MSRDHAEYIETLRDRVEEERGDEIAEADAERILEFSDQLYLLKSSYSDARHEKLLRHIVRIAEHVGGVAEALEDRDAAEEIVRWINRTYDNEETNRDYRVGFRVFAQKVTDGDDVPDSVDWVPATTSSNYDPAPKPSEMLHWEEHVQPMLEECQNVRDRAMIALQWDAGLRGGEFKSLTYGDVTDHTHGLQVTVDGKQGRRTVTLIPSVPYVTRWLADHPTSEPDDPLWCSLHRPFVKPTDRALTSAIASVAERAGVERPVTLTNFRKSSASYLASQGMSQAHLEHHHGWVTGSTAAARYIAVFADAADNELARIHGRDVSETEPDPVGPVECPRCGEDTPREREFCLHCSQALDPTANEQLETLTRALEDRAVAEGDSRLLDAAREARERPASALADDSVQTFLTSESESED
ncbi:site-specific integrase [Halobaculum marinum]|uniref:Site-specific integrase n=1 Tax=Halobaculum marinum TaxID=3031996 RepID=A0ABD5WR67_9EURY|nr:site-specific integrase [Halobaculum sp. DT55]